MPVDSKHRVEVKPEDFQKKLMCIEYPGLVKNVDKMIHTLGGIDNIGIAYGTKNRRVELRFRPDDIFCKPVCGEKNATIALLVKVKVKRQRRNPEQPCSSKDADKPELVTFTTKLEGVVHTIYKFNNLCDFQYLPMYPKSETGGKLENIHDRLKPPFVPTTAWLHEENVPLFLTPPVFSRFDSVHYYNAQKVKETDDNPHIIGRTRRRRTGYGIFLNFKDENVPKKPYAESLKMLHIKFLNEGPYETIKKLFEERPVWLKNALMYKTNFSKDQLKFLLPTVAYYFLTGPWRVMWVKYGYDPRKHPESRIYQTFDYRIRTIGGLKNKIKAKRSYSNYLLPYKSAPSSKPKVAIINRHSIARAYSAARQSTAKEILNENLYIFRPGMIPPSRQMFYQYCDVEIPEIQALLAKTPLPDPGSKCDIRHGWLPKGFDVKCREIVSSLVTAEIRKQIIEQQRKVKTDIKNLKVEPGTEEEDNVEGEERSQNRNEENIENDSGEKNPYDDQETQEIEISDTDETDISDYDTDALIDSDMEEGLKEQ